MKFCKSSEIKSWKTKHYLCNYYDLNGVFICFSFQDSSLQKLLFAQEVPHYQKKTEQFYKALGNKAAITDADFWSEMSRLSVVS